MGTSEIPSLSLAWSNLSYIIIHTSLAIDKIILPLDHPQHLRLNNTNSIPISWYAHYRIWLSWLLECVCVTVSRPRRLLDHHWSRLTWWFPPKIHFFFAESIIGSITLGLVIWKKTLIFEYDSIYLISVCVTRGKLIWIFPHSNLRRDTNNFGKQRKPQMWRVII